jgi:DNA-binding NarL/FixJ family response regulator
MMQSAVRAALVSSSPLVLAGLSAGLQRRGDFEIVLARGSLHELVAEPMPLAQVQVGIIDLSADIDGQSIAGLAEHGPALVLLAPDQAGPIADWLVAGCSLLPRDASIDLIAVAAHAAAAGLVASTPRLTAEALGAGPNADRRGAADEMGALTPRERQVLLQMSLGLGNREIGDALNISPHTAKFHVAQIIAKLDALSRAHAVAKALRSGLVEI